MDLSGRQVQISASILSADFSRLGEQVREAEAGGADAIHIDVMDGRFVPNITVGPIVVRSLRPVTHLPLHVHLMIVEPERYIDEFIRAGASLVTVHVETCPHLHRTLGQIREGGARPAVTLNPATPLAALEEVLDQVDQILVMTVNPGFGGQSIIPSTINKVRRLRQILNERGLSCAIEVDGGINTRTMGHVVQAGADILVIGAGIFAGEGGIQASLQRIRAAL